VSLGATVWFREKDAGLGEFQRRRPEGYTSCATSLLRQGPRQSEVCEKAALAEPRDGRHAVLT